MIDVKATRGNLQNNVAAQLGTAGLIAGAAAGNVISGSLEKMVTSFSIDSRTLVPGACFVALHAERDGHDFIGAAIQSGASAVLVNEAWALESNVRNSAFGPTDISLIAVPDTSVALVELARVARSGLGDIPVIAVTGSAGKTSTKDLLVSVLGLGREVLSSQGSFNNELGVPLTLLAGSHTTGAAVIEAGARFPGNIAYLADLIRPTIGVITNVGLAHVEHMVDRAGVARVKGELLEALLATDVAVIRAEDFEILGLPDRTDARVFVVGSLPGGTASTLRADVEVSEISLDSQLRPSFRIETPWGSGQIRVSLRGAHQVLNAAIAATAAMLAGASLDEAVEGLAVADQAPWRMEISKSSAEIVVINDSYNANPASMNAALDALIAHETSGHRWAVLGEMRELGEHSIDEHHVVGEKIGDSPIDGVVVVGSGPSLAALSSAAESGGVRVVRVGEVAAAHAAIEAIIEPGDVVLLKASRAVGLERIAELLLGGTS